MKAVAERVAPTSAEAAGEIVGACDRAGDKVSIVGGNTLEGMSLPPERVDVTLDVTALRGVVANERADLTLAVRAGTPLQDVATLLAAQGMFVPFDAPKPLYATVGGTLAAGWAGPRRHLYGRVRDYLIGSIVVLADGTIARAGGMVVKNVTSSGHMSRFLRRLFRYARHFGAGKLQNDSDAAARPGFSSPASPSGRASAPRRSSPVFDASVGGIHRARLR